MLEELRKNSIKSSLPGIIIILLILAVVLGFQVPHLIICFSPHERFEELDYTEIKDGMIVDYTMTENFGAFMDYTEDKKVKAVYYVIWTGDAYADDYRFMAIKVDPKYEDQLDQMAMDFSEGKDTTPIEFSGTIVKMDNEGKDYLYKYFGYSDYSRSEAMNATIPYILDTEKNVGTDRVIKLIGMFATLAGIAGVIYYLIWICKGNRLKKIKDEIASSPYSMDQASSDYGAAEDVSKKSMIKRGKLFLFFFSNGTPHAFALENLVWVYPHVTTHRTNGIKTGTTYAIMFVDASNRRVLANMINKKEMEHVMDDLSARYNWVIFGYTEELAKLPINQLKDLRYNQVPDKNSYFNPNNFNY